MVLDARTLSALMHSYAINRMMSQLHLNSFSAHFPMTTKFLQALRSSHLLTAIINCYVSVKLAIENEKYTGNHYGHKNDYCYDNYDHID